VDFEQSVKRFYDDFLEVHYSYEDAMFIADDAILNSNSFESGPVKKSAVGKPTKFKLSL
jgi:hypothetical protein